MNTCGIDNLSLFDLFRNQNNSESCQELIIEGIESLVTKGCDINSLDSNGENILFYSCRMDCPKIVSYLIKKNFPLNLKNRNGITSLHLSCIFGSYCCAHLILNRGAEVNILDFFNQSPLDKCNSQELVDLLIKYGAKKGAELHKIN